MKTGMGAERLCAGPAGWVRWKVILSVVTALSAPMLVAQQASAAVSAAQAAPAPAQTINNTVGPIAVVPIDSENAGKGATVTGALEVTDSRAIIAASGTVTSGAQTTEVILPHRGVLRVCASTAVKLAADTSVPAGEMPGLMMAMDHGAIEASFATGRNSDTILTPDFRILIGGPGAADVKVRLGERGDTCVDNAGTNAPYVLVSSVFGEGVYRVQPGQRVMFEHGSLQQVVDQEKEPCGCPASPPRGNEFPEAQSEGLAPLPKPAPGVAAQSKTVPQATSALVYNSADHAPKPTVAAQPTAGPANQGTGMSPAKKEKGKTKPGFFRRVGHFFRSLAGAD